MLISFAPKLWVLALQLALVSVQFNNQIKSLRVNQVIKMTNFYKTRHPFVPSSTLFIQMFSLNDKHWIECTDSWLHLQGQQHLFKKQSQEPITN